jgi:hypothetical protein
VCNQCTDTNLIATVVELMTSVWTSDLAGRGAPAPATPAAPRSAPIASRDDSDDGKASDADRASSDGTDGRSRHLLPYGLMGAGVAALIGGVVMFAIDEDPDPQDTTSLTYRDTATAGVVLGAAGAAALGVGIYLWLGDQRASRPVAAVTHDGAVVGWTGRF